LSQFEIIEGQKSELVSKASALDQQ